MPTLSERFTGCLLGLAVGDALGSRFEGQSPESIARRYLSVDELFADPPPGDLCYTDDTQMMIGVAETLAEVQQIDQKHLCNRFAANFEPHRGYGRGTRLVVEAMIDGFDHQNLAATLLPGGSFGNGAAMRVAPVGLMFRHDLNAIWEQARLSALPTHLHPLGIEGAQLLALAVGLCSTIDELQREEFFPTLAGKCASAEFSGPLSRAARVENPRDLALFGNGIAAASSVVTAIACFGLTPHSYEQTIGNAILLGGDTDTIAAMAGALSGAFLGQQAIPTSLLQNLEDGPQGRTYLIDLAQKLLSAHLATVRNTQI